MIPFFFGPQTEKKYGVFHMALGGGSKGRSVVFCDALFGEALRAHRALRYASESMAASRWSSLRFDYFATGDSAGDTSEFRLSQASNDIHAAVEEIKSMAGVSHTFLLGLRLGGTLAMNCAASRSDIRGVILWDPVVDGASAIDDHLKEIQPDTKGGDHQDGFIFPPGLLAELRGLSLRESIENFNGSILMICTSPTPEHYEIADAHPRIDFRVVDAPEAWSKEPGGGVKAIPTAVIRQMEAWPG